MSAQVEKNRLDYRCPPLWAVRWRDFGRYLLGLFRFRSRYPLADYADSLSCQPLFIVSAGRSGTTLLRSILVAGGLIAIPPETHVIRVAVRRFLSLQCLGWEDLSRLIVALFESHHLFHLWEINLHPVYQRVLALPEKERSLARIIDEVLQAYGAQRFPEAGVWGDQTPINTLFLPWVFRVFPQAKYVHLLRDGRDAISSAVATGRATVEQATTRWTVSVQQALALQDKLDAGQFLEVRYEELVTHPVETLKSICALIGIEYREQMLEYHAMSSTLEHRHFDFHQNVGRPLFTDSIGKWKQRLSSEQQEYVHARISDLLRRLEYQV